MYVCVCNRVTKDQLEEAVSEGALTLNALRTALNLGANCGSCLPMAKSLLNGNLQAMAEQNADLFYAA